MKSIEVIRLVVDGEHCVALVDIDTVFGVIPFAEHIQVGRSGRGSADWIHTRDVISCSLP